MSSLFAPPELLSAYAMAEDGSGPDLPFGTHLRIFAGFGASFPLAPFAVYKIVSQPSELLDVRVLDREGRPHRDLDLARLGVADIQLGLHDDDNWRTVRLELIDPDARLEGAAVLGPRGRRFAGLVRDEPRWLFSGPFMHRLHLWGSSSQLGINPWRVPWYELFEGSHELAGVLALPIDGEYTWYAHGDSTAAEGRVERGAPQRLNPMDRPDGQDVGISSDQELRRVAAMLASGQLGGGLETLLAHLVDDRPPPWKQHEHQPMQDPNGKRQVVRAPRLGTLQTAVMDPGLARHFGFATQFDDLPDLDGGGGWDTLAIVGLLALDPREYLRRGLDLTALHDDQRPGTHALLESLMWALEHSSGLDPRPAIAERMHFVRNEGLVAAPFLTVVAPVPPWLPPTLARPQVVDHRWQSATDGYPSRLYRASLAFPQPQVASLAALAAQFDGEWTARHDQLDIADGDPGQRAVPRVVGHETDPSARVRGLGGGALEPAGLLSDKAIPDVGPLDYRVWASDMFGRFGQPVDFTVEPPPRPVPPPPVLRYHLERAEIDPLVSADESPGVIRLMVAIPHAFPASRFTPAESQLLGSAIVVPRIDDLAAGSWTIESLTLKLGGSNRTVGTTDSGFTEVELPLPRLSPQQRGRWTLTGYFTDTTGVHSEVATLPIEVTDPRPPKVYPTGIGLFWSSAPGPSSEVELMLTWPAVDGSKHRVYLSDQQGLRLRPQDVAEAVAGVAPSRGRVAAAGCRRVLDGGQIDRTAFRLLTESPVVAGADGAVFTTRLPRSLETVQFLRIVPLGPDGAEPPFDSCGIVAVAVPDSRGPVAPRIDGHVDPATGAATLRVVTDGFDRSALQRDEPGLFDPGVAGTEPPRFRIRRAAGPVADPVYARVLREGPMQILNSAATPAVFEATFLDDGGVGRGLEPFVRYVYWAEVRLPPERRIPAGVTLLDPPGGVTVPNPAARQPHPRPLSPPSAPRVLMHLPPNPPDRPDVDTITVLREPGDAADEVKLTITVADAPRSHALAIGPYRAAIWYQWPGHAIRPAVAELAWPELSDGVVPIVVKVPVAVDPDAVLGLRVAFVDPAGRIGEIASLDV